MEELNESKTPEVLESRAAVEEFEIAEVSLKNAQIHFYFSSFDCA